MFIEEHTNGVRKEEIPHAGWIVLEYGYESSVSTDDSCTVDVLLKG